MTPGRSLVLMLLAALAVTRAGAQNVEDWRSLRSEHFLLVGNASSNAVKRVAERLEEFRSAVITLLPVLMPDVAESDETETTVVVFRHDRAFDPFKPIGSGNIAGYFAGGNYKNYIALTGDRDMERAIYHEYVHRVTAHPGSWRPWMREGVAELYSTIEIRDGGKKIRVGTTIPEHLAILRERYLPLDGLFQADPDYRGSDRQHLFYAQSWAMLHYLTFGKPELGAQLPLFNQALASGNDIPSSVQLAFGMDLGTLQSDFLIYVQNSLTFPATEYTLAVPLEEIEVPDAGDITQAEEDYYLGDLLRHLGRLDEARAHLERSIGAVPDFEPTLTSMFLLAEEQGRAEEAGRYLDRAAAIPDAGYLPRLVHAQRALTGTGGPDAAAIERAETQLRAVIAMKPRMADGYFWLGQSLMQRPEARAEAVALLETAMRLGRGAPPMAFAYAQALWLDGDGERAAEILAAVRPSALDPLLRSQIENLQDRIEGKASAAVLREPPAGGSGSAPRLDRSGQPSEPGNPASVVERRVPEGMLQAEGYLTRLVCLDGLRVVLSAGTETLEFTTRSPQNVHFTSYSPDIRDGIGCGEVAEPPHVRITYRPSEGDPAGDRGEPTLIEFLAD